MEITTERLGQIIGVTKHEFAPEWGERACIAHSLDADVVYWDTGNSWLDIMVVLPKNKQDDWLQWFFAQVISSSELEGNKNEESLQS